MNKFHDFVASEEGAVTVDWVVLTAGIAALGFAVMMSVGGQTKATADDIGTAMDNMSVQQY